MKQDKTSKNVAYTGLFAAVAASSCCIPPVIALIAGVGGSASALYWMEPFRPYLIGLAIIAIGYTWYYHLKPKNVDDCGCDIEKPKWFQTKAFLVAMTLFAAISISFPYYAHIFYPESKQNVVMENVSDKKITEFMTSGMTCKSCEEHVNLEVNKLDGIVNSKVSYNLGTATVAFDKTKTNETEIIKAINSTGYNVISKKQIK